MPNKMNGTCEHCQGVCDSRVRRCLTCKRLRLGDKTLKDRLLENVVIVGECWVFTGFKLPNGYGRIGQSKDGERKVLLAHRASWESHHGPIPGGMMVLHKCDNPPCVNPSHLFLGTGSDNMQDMLAKGRDRHVSELPTTRNAAHWSAKITVEQIHEIKRRASEPRRALAIEFKTTPHYISAIICNRKRKYA